jgi:tripartite-type tricarboxylate transporter receptor subunit TctC
MRPIKSMLVLFACALAATASSAFAQQFPSRPITIIVPFSAGGPTDTLARILAQRMTVSLGQNVDIENTTGAAGTIAVARAVRSAADGYTLSIGHVGTHVVNGAIYPLPYDLLKDLEPIAMVANNPQVLVGKKDIPAKTLAELIAWIKERPARVPVAHAGVGSPSHISGVYFEKVVGIPLVMIPFRGAAPAVQALMGGQVDLLFDQASNSLPQIRGKTITAYAVTAKNKLAAAPDIPTVDEAGLPEFYMSVWHGLWAPKGTPPHVMARLNAAVVDALADSNVRARLADLGQDIPTSEQQTPDGLASYQKAEIEKWWPVIKAANIKAE